MRFVKKFSAHWGYGSLQQWSSRTLRYIKTAEQNSEDEHRQPTTHGNSESPRSNTAGGRLNSPGSSPPNGRFTSTVLPHYSRTFHLLARSHHSRHRGKRPVDRLDIPLRLSASHHHQPETSVSPEPSGSLPWTSWMTTGMLLCTRLSRWR
jgi:hypothetical protein